MSKKRGIVDVLVVHLDFQLDRCSIKGQEHMSLPQWIGSLAHLEFEITVSLPDITETTVENPQFEVSLLHRYKKRSTKPISCSWIMLLSF